MKLETTAMAIPALDNRSPSETKLILDHVGNDYYLNKIWIQGKDYGYEFPLPSEIRRREREQNAPATVVAQYKAPAAQTTTAQASVTRVETAQSAPAQAGYQPAPRFVNLKNYACVLCHPDCRRFGDSRPRRPFLLDSAAGRAASRRAVEEPARQAAASASSGAPRPGHLIDRRRPARRATA